MVLVLGIALLFYDERSLPGWALAVGGTVVIMAGILANLQVHFRATSLFNMLVMLGLFTAGLGLVAGGLLRPRGV